MVALRSGKAPKPLPRVGLRVAGSELWEADVVDAGEDVILTDGVREERYPKSAAVRYVTEAGRIFYCLNVDFPCVTKAEELATLEERMCFDALNGSTQPGSERTWGMYINVALLAIVLMLAIWVHGASDSASRADASSASAQKQLTQLVEVVQRIDVKVSK